MYSAASIRNPDQVLIKQIGFFPHITKNLEITIQCWHSGDQGINIGPSTLSCFNNLLSSLLLLPNNHSVAVVLLASCLHCNQEEERVKVHANLVYPFLSGKQNLTQHNSTYISLIRIVSHGQS